VSVLVLRFCALKLIFKLISGKECIADGAPSFELVRRHKYSEELAKVNQCDSSSNYMCISNELEKYCLDLIS